MRLKINAHSMLMFTKNAKEDIVPQVKPKELCYLTETSIFSFLTDVCKQLL